LYDVIINRPLTCNWVQGSINDVSVGRQNVQIPLQRDGKVLSEGVQVNGVIALVAVVEVGTFTDVRSVNVELGVDGNDLSSNSPTYYWITGQCFQPFLVYGTILL
jgi:hypothetical protein